MGTELVDGADVVEKAVASRDAVKEGRIRNFYVGMKFLMDILNLESSTVTRPRFKVLDDPQAYPVAVQADYINRAIVVQVASPNFDPIVDGSVIPQLYDAMTIEWETVPIASPEQQLRIAQVDSMLAAKDAEYKILNDKALEIKTDYTNLLGDMEKAVVNRDAKFFFMHVGRNGDNPSVFWVLVDKDRFDKFGNQQKWPQDEKYHRELKVLVREAVPIEKNLTNYQLVEEDEPFGNQKLIHLSDAEVGALGFMEPEDQIKYEQAKLKWTQSMNKKES